jgi:hypothetical protein
MTRKHAARSGSGSSNSKRRVPKSQIGREIAFPKSILNQYKNNLNFLPAAIKLEFVESSRKMVKAQLVPKKRSG